MQLCPECEKPIGHHAPICPFCGTHVERAKAARMANASSDAAGCGCLLLLLLIGFAVIFLIALGETIYTWARVSLIRGISTALFLAMAIWGLVWIVRRATRREARYITSRGILTFSQIRSEWESDWLNDSFPDDDFILDIDTGEPLNFIDVLIRGKYPNKR